MREINNDPFYKRIGNYKNCIIDYCLMEDDTPYQGMRSHKDAILFAMRKVTERDIDTQLETELGYCGEFPAEPFPWYLDIGKAQARQIDPAAFFRVPEILGKDRVGRWAYASALPDPLKGEQIPYWYAFWETPHTSGYGPDEFRKVNAVLFPAGTDALEIYEWTTDWCDYFDDGHEWWGAACWSVYDRRLNRFVVIMASTTD